MTIPFDEINKAALSGYEARLKGWFPAGRVRGREFVVGDLSGAAGESLSINTRTGQWADFSGTDKGGDPVSLYAAAFCGRDQGEAAKRLAVELGMALDGKAPKAARAAPKAKAEEAEVWEPMAPPAGTADPPLAGYDGVWVYRDSSGARVGYVVRLNATAARGKVIFGVNYGRRVWTDKKGKRQDVTGWHNKHPAEPMALYGLDRLAARPDAPVMVCEGEKATDAATKMFPEHVCVSWPRGTANVEHVDWTPLAGRYVLIWPDNDPLKKGHRVGQEAAAKIAGLLDPIAADVVVLVVDDVKLGPEPDGEDAADIEVGDWREWLAAHQPGVAPAVVEGEMVTQDESPAPPPAEAPPFDGALELPAPTLDEGVIPLGHDRQIYFYYSVAARQVVELSPERHGRMGLCGLASDTQFWEQIPHLRAGKGGGVDWAAAAGWLMDQCRRVGIFNPDIVRGRGAWLDEGRCVLNLGDRLIVGGAFMPLSLPGSKYIYEAGNNFGITAAPVLSTSEAHKLVTVCEALRWERPVNAKLFAGFIAVAPICGALQWRPSIWVTGGRGSGKTFAMNSVLKKVLGKLALHVKSTTSESGIRAELGRDARPVLFDEAEAENAAAASRMRATLELVRQSSSSDDGEIIKGTQSQKSKKFRIQSCFALQSINVGLEFAADQSRFTVLGLKEGGAANPEDVAKFLEIENLVADTFTPEFSAGMLARSTALVHVIRANAEIFARAIASTLGTRRMGDQLGTLLAGAYSLHSAGEITPDAAEKYVAAGDWAESRDEQDEKDEVRALRHLMNLRLRAGPVEYSVSRLLENIAATFPPEGGPSFETCDRLLKEAGMKFENRGVFVATSHPELKKAFFGTPWATGWARALARLPKAVASTELPVQRFALGSSSRAVWVPMSALEI